jgi:hypothetical protein
MTWIWKGTSNISITIRLNTALPEVSEIGPGQVFTDMFEWDIIPLIGAIK